MPTTTSCPYCKGEIPAGASKCQHCGEWLDPKTRDRVAVESGAGLAFKVLFVVVGLIALVAVVWFASASL